jgi:hypothetical protein
LCVLLEETLDTAAWELQGDLLAAGMADKETRSDRGNKKARVIVPPAEEPARGLPSVENTSIQAQAGRQAGRQTYRNRGKGDGKDWAQPAMPVSHGVDEGVDRSRFLRG